MPAPVEVKTHRLAPPRPSARTGHGRAAALHQQPYEREIVHRWAHAMEAQEAGTQYRYFVPRSKALGAADSVFPQGFPHPPPVSWKAPPKRSSEYRYGDSNPGFRTENPAS